MRPNDPPPDGLPAEVRERIARAIHERYRRHQDGRKPPDDPAMQPWDRLGEPLKDSNRAQAADIGRKLGAIGCTVVPVSGRPAGFAFTPNELEALAVMEHDRWVDERRRAGWIAGPARDPERKITPYLVPWEELDEAIREYDREAVRVIPDVLAVAGLEARREGPARTG